MKLNNDTSSIILSIIWGLGVACIFRKICDNNECIIVRYPDNLDEYLIEDNKKCYNFEKEMCKD